jgi:3-deoxy-manno-octulosonate cytidylyltransferase (CMP-KDO synthetase)
MMRNKMKIVGIIPARFAASRLPGKPLLDIAGKTMIQRVYESVKKSKLIQQVIIATDDERIKNCVEDFGGIALMTSAEHQTGDERVAEIARKTDCEVISYIQCDEPFIMAEIIDEVLGALLSDRTQVMTTCCHAIQDPERLKNPHVVKVVSDIKGNALMFSRSLIPFPRYAEYFQAYEHIGVFAYTKKFLLQYVSLPQTPLAFTESIEQLKALESGYKIKVVKTRFPYTPPSVDTLEDLETVRNFAKEHGL